MLKFPYPRCVEEPETYDLIRVHAEWGAKDEGSKSKENSPIFAVRHLRVMHFTLVYIRIVNVEIIVV